MDSFRHTLASCSLAMVVFGCFGNCLTASIFLRRNSSINIFLSALAFIDIGLLLFAIPVFILPNLDTWEGFITSEPVQAIIVKFLYPVNLMFQTWSIYTIVLITAERWLAICRPLHVRYLCTSRTAKCSLLCTATFSILYNVVRFWEYSLRWPSSSAEGELSFERNLRDPDVHPAYVLWYYSLLFLLTHFLLPFLTIFTLNAIVCHRILRLRSIREQLTKKQRREHSTTTMLLLVTLSFALCNALPFLLNLAECIKGDLFQAEQTANLAYCLNDLANFLVILNSSTTWIFYTAFSAKYREGVAAMFGLRTTVRTSKNSNAMAEERYSVSATSNTQNQGF